MRNIRFVALLASVGLLAAACGGGATTADSNGEIVISMTEFAFSPNNIEVAPGQTVTFVLVNDGEKEHEFMAGRDVMFADGVANGFEHDFFEDVSPMVEPMDALVMDMGEDMDDEMDEEMDEEMDMGDEVGHTGFMVARLPNEQARITLTIPEDASGEFEFGCFEEEGAHWDDGMKGTLTVTAGA